ncbi:MAG: 3-deoxy-D-manno-octulosonic acid transferase [Planctomycetes bacterium]|nr:3-deoxy-D-manno-octulosonic acid transferase [Planctomycetota bacterium]
MSRRRRDARGPAAPRPAPPLQVWVLHGLYDVCYLTLLVVLAPLFLYKLATSRRARAGLRQRLGGLPRRRGERPCLWIHGVSVGEVKAAMGLLEALPARLPGWEPVISTTTLQGYRLAQRSCPGVLTFYYPLDFSLVTRRALARIRPAAVVLMELELWPNFLLSCDRLGVPVCLVNGRISARSYRGYRVARRFLPEPHQRIRFYGVQNEEYATRIRNLGVRPEVVHVTGQMKYDTIDVDPDRVPELRRDYRAILGIEPDAWVLIGGSTHPSEEEDLLAAVAGLAEDAAGGPARLILAPRHLERLAEVEAVVRRAGFPLVRRTELPAAAGRCAAERAVVLVDTIGELGKLYAVADLVFVGGSLVPHGGQSMIEPAGLGLAILFGPHVWNFQDSVAAFVEAHACVQLRDRSELAGAVRALHRDAPRRHELGRRARAVVAGLKGATERNLDLIVRMVSS